MQVFVAINAGIVALNAGIVAHRHADENILFDENVWFVDRLGF